MATKKTISPATVRAQREATVTRLLDKLTGAVRALSSPPTSIERARLLRDRYCRAIGAPPGAGGDDVVHLLQSRIARHFTIEDLDHVLLHSGRESATA